MNAVFRKIMGRPVIVLTVVYVLALIVADSRGFFSAGRRSALARAAGQTVVVAGTVIGPPEKQGRGYAFSVAAARYRACLPGEAGRDLRQPGEQRVHAKAQADDAERAATRDIPAADGRVSERVLVRCYGNAPPVEPGDRIAVTGRLWLPHSPRNPGGFDYANYLNRQGVYTAISARRLEKAAPRARDAWRRWAFRMRQHVVSTAARFVPEPESDILIPMLVGDKSRLTPEVREAFTDAGLMHILVVSGLNVAYVSAMLFFFLRLTGISPGKASLLTVPGIILYVLVTGASPPVVRAGIMAVFVIFSLGLDREPLIAQSLCMAVLVILGFDPQALFTASFQLSFAATFGIVLLYGPLRALFNHLPRWLAATLGSSVAVTFAAQAAVMPLIAWYFNKISLIGLAANVAVVPFTGLITAGGMTLYLLSFASATLAGAAGALLHYAIYLLQAFVNFFAAVPHGTISVAAPSIIMLTACYAALAAAVAAVRLAAAGRKRAAAACTAAVVLLFAGSSRLWDRGPGNAVTVTFLDTGGGDAVHLSFPDGENWLVDGGGSYERELGTGCRVIVPYLRSQGVRRIDRVVITHPHLPHYGGLGDVLEAFEVREIVVNPQPNDEPEYAALMEKAGNGSIPVREAWAGDVLRSGISTVTVLSPGQWYFSEDDNGLMLNVAYHGRDLFLTADSALAASLIGASGRGAVIQVPNHGNRGDAGRFIRLMGPAHAVISGPMPPDISGGRVYATADDGAIRVYLRTDGVRVRRFGRDRVF